MSPPALTAIPRAARRSDRSLSHDDDRDKVSSFFQVRLKIGCHVERPVSRTPCRDVPRHDPAALGRPWLQPGSFRVGAQRFVCPRLPARPGCAIHSDNIAIDAQADHFLGRRLLRTTLTSVPANRFDDFLWKHIESRSGPDEILIGPFRVFSVRAFWILSDTAVPVAHAPGEG